MRVWSSHASARNRSHTPIVESDGIDDKRVALPVSNRVAIGGGIEIVLVGMRASVGVDVPHGRRRFGDHTDDRGALSKVKSRTVSHQRRYADIDAPANRVGVLPPLIRLIRCGLRCERCGLNIEAVVSQFPISGQIWMRGRWALAEGQRTGKP